MLHRKTPPRHEHSLAILAGLLLLSFGAYLPLSNGSILADLPEIVIPVGVSLGLAMYTLLLLQGEREAGRIKQMALYGWAGAIGAAFGAWWLVQELQHELGATILLDEALTVVSIGTGVGVVAGAHVFQDYSSRRAAERTRVLAETAWASEPEPNKMITTQIAEIEGVDPRELEPLYEHIDPNVLAELKGQTDAQWRLAFYADGYEIRVSSHGTVTILDGPD